VDYKKTNWISDETLVSAENLNNIEDGIEGLAQESHTHSNQGILNGISEDNIAAWDKMVGLTMADLKVSYKITDLDRGSQYYTIPAQVGDYIYITNDTNEAVSDLYYNDDVKYKFSAELKVGETYPCLMLQDITSTVDDKIDGLFFVVSQNGINNLMLANGCISQAHLNPALSAKANMAHIHINQAALDGIKSEDIEIWNNAITQMQRPVTFVVGNVVSGHTLGECDYLCDGVEDNAEINAAIQALPSGGGTIKILAGEYILSNSLNLNKHGMILIGDGPGTKIKLPSTSNSLVVSANNITIRDIAIPKGNTTNGNPIFAQDIEGLTIDNVNISDCFYAIQLKAVRKSYIRKCTITSSKGGINVSYAYINGVYVPSERIVITGNFISGIIDSGVSVNAPSKGVLVSDNHIQDCGTGVTSLINTDTQVSNIIIKSNTCINNQYCGIRIQATSSNEGSTADSIHIDGNTCGGSQYGIWIQGYSTKTNFKKSTISNNILVDNDNAICLVGAGDTIINDNLCIRGDGTPSDYTSAQSTIVLTGCSRCLVGHNMLRGKSYNSTNNINIVFSENDITTT
jgi:hypothetical protein